MGLDDLDIIRIAMNQDISEAFTSENELKRCLSQKFVIDKPYQISESKAILKLELNSRELQELENDLCSNNSCNNDNDVIYDTQFLVTKLSLISENF